MIFLGGGIGLEGDDHLKEDIHEADNLQILFVLNFFASLPTAYLLHFCKAIPSQFCNQDFHEPNEIAQVDLVEAQPHDDS